ncbi:MAG: carboxypeptidase regulatory-like domain-containing protein [Myxococcales bacterium]|nr:carboxypeptidase regulatory-like domain-containing protein [Myxococcales bacterium]
MNKLSILVVALLVVLLPVQSGGQAEKPAGTATVTGSVKFEGKKPRIRAIDMSGADAKCSEAHGGKRLKPDTVIINKNGTLRNAFVWVKSGLEGKSFPMPEGDAMLDQKGCTYTPHVQGMRKGQSLAIKTSDPTAHNVHGYAKVNRSFNRSQPAGAGDVSIRMRRDESSPPMKIKCDIHPWMNAYVAVVDHPYYAVTGEDGSFTLANLPAGTYIVEVWHEKYGVMEETITIGDGEAKSIEFTYAG